jgi:hypothetical protein
LLLCGHYIRWQRDEEARPAMEKKKKIEEEEDSAEDKKISRSKLMFRVNRLNFRVGF